CPAAAQRRLPAAQAPRSENSPVPVSVALVGSVGVGKSTLFAALTEGRGHDGVGMVDVPDARLDQLAAAVHPKKIVPAQVRLVDAPPGSRAQRVAAAREADVLLEVARAFGPEPAPVRDLEEIELDLVLSDLASVERRIELVEREARAGKKGSIPELDGLRSAKEHLDHGQPLRTLALEADARSTLDALFLVTLKPVVSVANVSEDLVADGEAVLDSIRSGLAGREPILVSAQLESELVELDPQEAVEYRQTYGLARSGLETVARAVWDAGGLVTFFTAGEPEVR